MKDCEKTRIFCFKKACVFIVVLLLTLPLYAGELTVMSFNICGHGSAEHRARNSDWLDQIVEIIKESNVQIVLLQEVAIDNSDDVAKSLVEKLDSDWDYVTSFDYSISSMDLNNAALYNTRYVTLRKDFAKELNMLAYKQNRYDDKRKYKFAKNNEQILEFSCKNTPDKSFLVINVHFPFNNNITEERAFGDLYANYKGKYPIIVAGDFNKSRKDLQNSPGINDGTTIVDGEDGRYSDSWGQRTTVSERDSITMFKLANDYDHFIISSKKSYFKIVESMHLFFTDDKIETSIKEIKIGNYVYKKAIDYTKGRDGMPSISDHIPIVIKLSYV